jgi:hypothetical protein
VTALVIALALTNVITLAVVVAMARRNRSRHASSSDDPRLIDSLSAVARPIGPSTSAGKTRRFISIEILNPIELAGVRSRMFGIAGSFVPHLTRRIVYDQTVRQLRDQLNAHNVVADVRIHVLPETSSGTPAPAVPISLDASVEPPAEIELGPAYEPPV